MTITDNKGHTPNRFKKISLTPLHSLFDSQSKTNDIKKQAETKINQLSKQIEEITTDIDQLSTLKECIDTNALLSSSRQKNDHVKDLQKLLLGLEAGLMITGGMGCGLVSNIIISGSQSVLGQTATMAVTAAAHTINKKTVELTAKETAKSIVKYKNKVESLDKANQHKLSLITHQNKQVKDSQKYKTKF